MHRHVSRTVGLWTLALAALPALAAAQEPSPTPRERPDTNRQSQDWQKPPASKDTAGWSRMQGMKGMKRMQGMQGMQENPHHQLAMAYHANLMTFTRVVQSDAESGKSVTRDLARPAVAEMQRSFDEFRKHHQAYASAPGTTSDSTRKSDLKDVTKHQTALATLLTSLRQEVGNDAPSAAKVTTLATDILKECEGMPGMREEMRSARMR